MESDLENNVVFAQTCSIKNFKLCKCKTQVANEAVCNFLKHKPGAAVELFFVLACDVLTRVSVCNQVEAHVGIHKKTMFQLLRDLTDIVSAPLLRSIFEHQSIATSRRLLHHDLLSWLPAN